LLVPGGLLVLVGPLARLVEHLLLLQRVRDHGCLAGEVEVLANRLLRGGAAAEGVVVEVIGVVVELIAEAVVGLFEVDAGNGSAGVVDAQGALQPTHRHRLLPLHRAQQRRRAG
jgi:hypothetical protein